MACWAGVVTDRWAACPSAVARVTKRIEMVQAGNRMP
jgi:hypothetical protein